MAGTHRPMNPHKQRLLAAEARAVVLPKESKTKPKKRAPSKAALKEKKASEDPESSRSAYSMAKRAFMDKLLDQILFIYLFFLLT